MAGDWIKVDHTLPGKPEIDRIARILKIDHDMVVGKLIRFWIWADQQSINGDALSVTETFIDRVVDHSLFADAMKIVGWLVKSGDSFSIPNFERHNGKSAKARALTRNRMQRSRDGVSVTRSSPEKRREEKNINPPLPPVGGAPKPAGFSKDDLSDVSKIRRWLGRRGKSIGLRNDHVTLTMLVAASERALEVGDDPVGLFISLAEAGGKGDWSKISGSQHDRAKLRMRDETPGAALAESNGVDHDET